MGAMQLTCLMHMYQGLREHTLQFVSQFTQRFNFTSEVCQAATPRNPPAPRNATAG